MAAFAEQKGLVIGSVTRRVDGAQAQVADVQLRTGLQIVDVGAQLRGQLAATGDVIVVEVRVQRVRELDSEVRSQLHVALDIAQRIDDKSHAAIGVGDEKARVAQLAGGDRFDSVHVVTRS